MSNFLTRKKSEVHGSGIFTLKKIAKNKRFYTIPMDNIFDYNPKHSHCAHIGNGKYAYDEKVLNWVNHSCKPNTKLNVNSSAPALIALRDIEKGEEITCNYNETEPGPIQFKCSCGNHQKNKRVAGEK